MKTFVRYRFPDGPDELEDVRSAIIKYVLPGYAPEAPIYGADSTVVTVGSCFAENIAKALADANVAAHHLKYFESANSVAATDAIVRLSLAAPSDAQDRLRKANLIVLTVGVAIAPFVDDEPVLNLNRDTAARAQWRFLGPDQIVKFTLSTVERIRAINPDVGVVLTISPLPIRNSIGHPSVFAQDCLSKSSIRLGIEHVLELKLPGIYYWPSFEMVRGLSPHVSRFFGTGGADNRHVDPGIIKLITDLFVDLYFRPI